MTYMGPEIQVETAAFRERRALGTGTAVFDTGDTQ